jgi:hypothetical protein
MKKHNATNLDPLEKLITLAMYIDRWSTHFVLLDPEESYQYVTRVKELRLVSTF